MFAPLRNMQVLCVSLLCAVNQLIVASYLAENAFITAPPLMFSLTRSMIRVLYVAEQQRSC